MVTSSVMASPRQDPAGTPKTPGKFIPLTRRLTHSLTPCLGCSRTVLRGPTGTAPVRIVCSEGANSGASDRALRPPRTEWEQGRRVPDRAARVLLTVIDREPEAVVRALSG